MNSSVKAGIPPPPAKMLALKPLPFAVARTRPASIAALGVSLASSYQEGGPEALTATERPAQPRFACPAGSGDGRCEPRANAAAARN